MKVFRSLCCHLALAGLVVVSAGCGSNETMGMTTAYADIKSLTIPVPSF